MELYYKNLISKESSLEKLVDDLMLVVQGASELAQAAGAHLGTESHREIATRLERLKSHCRALKANAGRGVLAVDKAVHEYPYVGAGLAFALGIGVGMLVTRRKF